MTETTAGLAGGVREMGLMRAWGWAVGICAVFFLAVAPTLSWLEFSGGSENLNVATVLEMHRGGPWVVPTLKERPRLAKPPLTAWTTAAFVSAETVRQLDSTDARVRDAAYRQLAWEVRWPALLLCCITMLGVFEMTRVLAGPRAGLVAMVFFAGALMTLRFGRAATTDVQLMAWVTWAIVGLLHAGVRGRWWTGCAVAGICLGLAFMAKGPVAFVQAVAPVVVARLMLRGTGLPRVKVWPVLLCVLLTATVGLPWYLLQFHQHGWAVMDLWKVEVLREGATDLPRDPIWSYLSFFLLMMPWAPLLIMGLVEAVEAWRKKTAEMRSLVMLGCMVLVPLVIMSCFKDKNERYTLPVTSAACALMAAATLPVLLAAMARTAGGWRRVVVDVTFALPVGVAIVLAVCGALGGEAGRVLTLLRADGQPWHSPLVAVLAATAALAVTLLGHTMRYETVLARPLAGFVAMLIAGALFVHGYSHDARGLAEFRTTAFHLRDTHGARPLYSLQNPADRIFHDLNIYLNRVVREVKTIEEVPAEALLIQIRRTSANPFVPPDGWEMLETRVVGKRTVYLAQRAGISVTSSDD